MQELLSKESFQYFAHNLILFPGQSDHLDHLLAHLLLHELWLRIQCYMDRLELSHRSMHWFLHVESLGQPVLSLCTDPHIPHLASSSPKLWELLANLTQIR